MAQGGKKVNFFAALLMCCKAKYTCTCITLRAKKGQTLALLLTSRPDASNDVILVQTYGLLCLLGDVKD